MLLAKAGQDGGGQLQARSEKWLEGNERAHQMESKRLRSSPSPCCLGFRRLSPGAPRGPLLEIATASAMMEIAMVVKDGKFVVMLVVHYATFLRPSELCNLTVSVRREQLGAPPTSSGRNKTSKTKEFDRSALQFPC